jgi:arginyl-tRNA synthetase
MKQQLLALISDTIQKLYTITLDKISLEFTNNLEFGDLQTNVAFLVAKQAGKSPKDIAVELTGALQQQLPTTLQQRIAAITPVGGFINLSLSNSYLWDNLLSIDSTYGNSAAAKPQRILIEFGQPNTHKSPHIGHLFSYIVGDSLVSILSAAGHSVMTANYQGDIGPHVAKSLYGYIQLGRPVPATSLEKVKLLQTCYQEGSKAYDEDPIAKETIDDINRKIYNHDPEIVPIWQETRQWSVDYYKEFEERLGVNQTYHYWESDIWKKGKAIVEDQTGKVFEKSEGAVIFPGKKFGLHDRVFITKNKTPTYEAKDVGLNIQKYADWQYDLNIITTASEQNAYFGVVIKAIETVAPELTGKLKHIGFGMVSLSTGKMSSRTGQIISAIDLIDEISNRVAAIVNERTTMSDTEKEKIIKNVTFAAIKFTFLKQNILQDTKFDIEESVSFDGRSGPYILYTYARIQSILAQLTDQANAIAIDYQVLKEPAEIALLRWLYRFPQIVVQAADSFSPHVISEYAYQTAQYFTAFYTSCPIIKAASPELVRARRAIAQQTAVVIKNALALIGIDTVQQM